MHNRYLYDNKLTSIPDGLGNLKDLSVLFFIINNKYNILIFYNRSLSNNHLTSIPVSLSNLSLLERM